MRAFERVNVCGIPLWVRADPTFRVHDLAIAEGPLRDEYLLEPIANDGHSVAWVVDIGAFLGTFTIKAKLLWPDAKVIAFEPAPDSAELFRRNTAAFKDVFFHEAAAVRRGGEGVVHLSVTSDGFEAARRVAEVIAQFGDQPVEVEPVRGIALLSVLEQYGNPEISVLKIDAEGVEADLLEDLKAVGYLPRIGWIRGEWHYYPSVSRIKESLAETHVCSVVESSWPWGAFIAHHKDLSRELLALDDPAFAA